MNGVGCSGAIVFIANKINTNKYRACLSLKGGTYNYFFKYTEKKKQSKSTKKLTKIHFFTFSHIGYNPC